MAKPKALGPDIQALYTYAELPTGANAIGLPTERRKTGLWRYVRPAFEEKRGPCEEVCPLGNGIQRFLAGVREGNLEKAWFALKLENPFPGLCGRVCHHPCEGMCNRAELEGAVSIQGVERYLGDRFLEKVMEPPLPKKGGKRTAVVGSGPAGLACAYFLILMGYEVDLFEASDQLGGIPQAAIPSFRLPREILNREIEGVLSLGINLKTGSRVGQEVPFAELKAYDAAFLATGAPQEIPLDLPGRKAKGIYRGLDFLARVQRNERIHLGERVLVIGGGNVAVDVAMSALRLGASSVSLVCLESRAQMPAWPEQVEEALEEGVQLVHGWGPKRFVQEKGRLRGIAFRRCVSLLDEEGAFRPRYDEGEVRFLDADTGIIAIGQRPDLSLLRRGGLDVEGEGPLQAHSETLETSTPGIFAGGDMVGQPRSVAHAIGSGKRAAIAMDHYLKGDDLRELVSNGSLTRTMHEHLGLEQRRKPGEPGPVTLDGLNLAYTSSSPRERPRLLSPGERIRGFSEVNPGLDPQQAVKEAERCLSCGRCRMCGNCYLFCPDGAIRREPEQGRYAVEYDYCKGCGICQNECPAGAIQMESEGEDLP